jgi:hypothetical protein
VGQSDLASDTFLGHTLLEQSIPAKMVIFAPFH